MEETESYDSDNSKSSEDFAGSEFRQSKGTKTDEETRDQKIIDAILNALPSKHQQGDSIKSFEDGPKTLLLLTKK